MAAAARWLGVARATKVGTYRDLPPAAVILHERHLAYAAATGVARLTVERLPFGAEDDRVAWSHANARWRLVRVRYPRRRPAWGMAPVAAIAMGLLWTVILCVLAWFAWRVHNSFLDVIHRRSDLFDTVNDPALGNASERIVTMVAAGIAIAIGLASPCWGTRGDAGRCFSAGPRRPRHAAGARAWWCAGARGARNATTARCARTTSPLTKETTTIWSRTGYRPNSRDT
jgi:hypothetical protein